MHLAGICGMVLVITYAAVFLIIIHSHFLLHEYIKMTSSCRTCQLRL